MYGGIWCVPSRVTRRERDRAREDDGDDDGSWRGEVRRRAR